MCSPEGLLAQVLREAADAGVTVNGENALARFDDDAFAQIVRTYERYSDASTKPVAPLSSSTSAENVVSPSAESRHSLSSDDTMMMSSPSSSHGNACALGSFTYLRMCDKLFEPENFNRFARFVRDMRRTQF
jgi:beta-amylase